MATLNNTNTYTRTMSGLSSVYSDDIEVSNLSVSGTATLPNGYMTLSGSAQTTTSQKTFTQPYQDFTLVNPFMRDFSNNGFTVPAFQGAIANMITTVGAYNTTYSNWTFVSGASASRINYVQWWYGSGTQLEWTQNQIVGAPPTANAGVFSGNYAIRFESNAPTQSFYTQMGVNLPAGYYTMTFYSFFGSSPFGGGYIGSTSAFVNITVQNSTDTLNYSDPDTRANGAWKLRTFNFQVVGSNATYIRWTPNEAVSAIYTFRWALAGISIRRNNGNFFTDASGTTLVGGNYSLLQNPVLNNPIAQGTLTCQGTPQFSLKTGASNLVLNSDFNSSNSNVNNVAIGWGLASNPLMTNNTIVGSYGGGKSTSLVDCSIYGYYNSGMNRDTMIGSYLRATDASYNFNGFNTVIGTYIGVDSGGNRTPTAGVAWRCVAIGSEQFTSYNGFGKNPRSPAECISIGYKSQNKSWDNFNVSVGNYTLLNINGNNGTDDGLGYIHYTQYNTAIGHEAGTFGNNYSYNTFIGARADASLNDCSFNTAIGYNAKANAFRYCSAFGSGVVNTVADSIRLGRPADTVYIDGSLNVAKDTTITGNLIASGTTTFAPASIADTALSSNVPLKNTANTFTQLNTFTNGLTISAGNFTINEKTITLGSTLNIFNSTTTRIITNTTITKPYDQFVLCEESLGTGYTITLPTITGTADLGKAITFRKVKKTLNFNISFIGNGTQYVYNRLLSGSLSAQALMPPTVYKITLVPLFDATVGAGYAWFQMDGEVSISESNTFTALNTFNAGLTVSNTILTANNGITASNGITVSTGDLSSPNLKTSGALDILSTGTGNVSMTATNGDVKLMGYGTNKGVRFMNNGTYTNVFFDNPPSYVGGTGLTFDANYQVFKNTSIRASKEYITEIPDDHAIYNLETFMKIKPSLFYPKQGFGNQKKRCIGFIAEEINEIGLKELNTFEDNDLTKISGVHYEYFSAYLVKAIQLQQKIIQKQQTQIDDFKQLIDKLSTRICALETKCL